MRAARAVRRFVPRFGCAKEPLLRWVKARPSRRCGKGVVSRPSRRAAFRCEPRMKLPGRRSGS